MKYSIEMLYHFQCEHCSQWWSIGDADIDEVRYCPHCGKMQEKPYEELEWEQPE